MLEILKNWYLIFFPISISIGQVLFKSAAQRLDATNSTSMATSMLINLHFWGALIIYGLATIFWVFALSKHPLSQAYIYVGLSFVFVPLLSHFIFSEELSSSLLIGSILITSGVVLISASS